MRTLPESLTFTADQARACGWTTSSVDRAVRRGELVRVRRGVFARPGSDERLAGARAAVTACRGSVASFRSGLAVHDLPIVGRPRQPQVTVRPDGTGDLTGANLHRATLGAGDIVVVDGCPVTSIARTLIDVARIDTAHTAVSAIDAALRRGSVSTAELEAQLVRCWTWPGIRRAARAVRLSDARAESPLESVSRLVLAWAGLPRPDLQSVVLGERGRVLARLDFYWDEWGVAGEADGLAKYDQDERSTVLAAEKLRQERLEDLGLIVVRWGWADVTRRPGELRRRIEKAFERGARRDRSGFPRSWSLSAPESKRRGEDVITSAL